MTAEVVAEIGVNHNNDREMASRLINAAVQAGATAVKFQASTVDEEVSQRLMPDHYAMLKKVVPDRGFLKSCAMECDKVGVEFLCTPAGLDSLKWVLDLGVKRLKISSDNMSNAPLLVEAVKTKLPLIISTGMHNWMEVYDLTQALTAEDAIARTTLLHCVSLYPTRTNEVNLSVIPRMRAAFRVPVGWSDHTDSSHLAAVAVGMGACLIEKHITMDRDMEGPDHRASLEPHEFRLMVDFIRDAEEAIGNNGKWLSDREREAARTYGKSLVATAPIKKGEALHSGNMGTKRPGAGIPASAYSDLLNHKAQRDYEEGELI